ncbi:hypothetical protein OV924_25470, partial [Salmonella enterica subsp. enterica serovar 1,4,[5],12:i:-]
SKVLQHLLHPSEHDGEKIQKVTFRVHCSSYAFAFYTWYGYGSRCWSPWGYVSVSWSVAGLD